MRGLYGYKRKYAKRTSSYKRKSPFTRKYKSGTLVRGKGAYYASSGQSFRSSSMYGAGQDNQLISGSRFGSAIMGNKKALSGDITITKSEFVGNIAALGNAGASSGFFNQQFFLNPGIVGTFPWGSQVANNFVLYDFEGLMFEYRPTSGEFGNNASALGKVILATNYDPDAPAFTSSVQAENYDYAVSGKPSVPIRHGVECKQRDNVTNMLYVRTGTTTKDLALTDLGTLQVMTEGIPLPAGGTGEMIVGELWVHYKIRLSRAQIFESLLGSAIQTDAFVGWSNNNTSSWFSATGAFLPGVANYAARYALPPIPNTAAAKLTNNLGGTCTSATGNTIVYTFPTGASGTYRITFWASTGGTTTISGTPTCVNCNLLPGGYQTVDSIQGQNFLEAAALGAQGANFNAMMQTFIVGVNNGQPVTATVTLSVQNNTKIGNCPSTIVVDQVNARTYA